MLTMGQAWQKARKESSGGVKIGDKLRLPYKQAMAGIELKLERIRTNVTNYAV